MKEDPPTVTDECVASTTRVRMSKFDLVLRARKWSVSLTKRATPPDCVASGVPKRSQVMVSIDAPVKVSRMKAVQLQLLCVTPSKLTMTGAARAPVPTTPISRTGEEDRKAGAETMRSV